MTQTQEKAAIEISFQLWNITHEELDVRRFSVTGKGQNELLFKFNVMHLGTNGNNFCNALRSHWPEPKEKENLSESICQSQNDREPLV